MSRCRRLLAALALLVAGSDLAAAEAGYPLITFFRQEQHQGGTQTFDIARDARGRLYFANLDGLLIHDGAWWSRIDVPGYATFEVRPHPSGIIGVGSEDEFGYVAPGPTGTLAYHSLISRVPPELRTNIGQPGICATPDGLLYVAPHFAALWNGSSLRVVERNPGADRGRHCYEQNGRFYFLSRNGMKELGGKTTFAGRRIDALAAQYIVVRNEGLFLFDETPVESEASAWLRGKGVMNARVLRDGRIAIATLRYGLLIMTADGRIDQIIDAAAGLPDVFLFAVEQDAEGAVWLGLDTMIARVDLAAPTTVFDQRVGLDGPVLALTRHDGKLHAALTKGVYVLESSGTLTHARRLPGLEKNNPWSVLSSHGDLLAGTYGGVFVMRDGGATLVEGTAEETVYAMKPSPRDPSLVWLGIETGLAKLRRDGNSWRYEGLVPNSAPHVRSIVEDRDGAIWCGTENGGVARIATDGSLTRYGSGISNAISIAGRLVIVSRKGFHQPGPRGTLVPDPLLGHITGDDVAFYAESDAAANVWISARPPRVVRRRPDGTYEREAHTVGWMEGDAETFFADADGTMWIGSDRGLYRVAKSTVASAEMQPVPSIRRVLDGGERVLFDGAAGAARPAIALPYDFGRVRIEVAPLSYRATTQYQYRLDPVDHGWSPWTEQAFLDYTNLGANDYTFRVRTRGPAGVIAKEATWQFAVLAPWYATRWAGALWLVLALLLIATLVRLRTRALRSRARRLQSLVDEQTVMLRRANERLEQLSFVDALTGLANRRAFDRALGTAWKRAARQERSLSIVMMDIDHFKSLNDSQGHAAGDECLRRVARHLETMIRGDGDDVVARWGGEEFVILLDATDEATALAVAERIRAGIESFGVTASLGVAARGSENDAEELIQRADRALYQAKRAGRNCVRVDEERMTA